MRHYNFNKQFFLQFVKFGIVGCSNTIISYVVYVVCVYLGVHYIVANAIGFVVGVLNAFVWSNKYVFIKDANRYRNMWVTLLKTFIAYASTGLLLNSILLYLYVEQLSISSYIAQLLCLIITVPLNFIINKYWAYKDKQIITNEKD